MSSRRELAPEEVAEIAALAAAFDDLRQIRPLIAELQQRLDDLGNVSLDAVIVRPRSVSDLIELHKAKLVDAAWVKTRLGIKDAAPEGGPAPAPAGYTFHDKRTQG
jgi:hypothetical protein